MRRGMVIGVVLLAILAMIGIGVGAYNAGLSNGLEQTGAEVVRVDDHRDGFLFFPFGFLLFPLFFFGIFFLLKGAFWRGHWHGGPPGPGYWGGGPHGVEEWHRRLHEEGTKPGEGPTTA